MYIAKRLVALGWGLALVSVTVHAVDPTQPIDLMPPPPGVAESAASGISVNMILVRGGQALALVNGRYVRVNDEIAGAKVVAIDRNSVELQQGNIKTRHYLAGFGAQTEKFK